MEPIIGIDLGTTNSAVSLVQDVIVVGGNYAGSRSYPGNKDGTPFLRVGGRWR